MSVTYGFYNSLNGDRKYDAVQFSSIFDGLVIDGIFASIGNVFNVKAAGGLTITVDTGKAWFNHTWTYNDSILPLTAPDSEVLLNRIDAVVIEVNATESERKNSIKIISGTPAYTPERPKLAKENDVYQYPLCYIYRKYGSTEIMQSDITSMIGTKSTPFITGILQTVSLDDLLGQWQDDLDRFTSARKEDVNDWISSEEDTLNTWLEDMKSQLFNEQELLDQWIDSEQNDFLAWYTEMKNQLSEDSAGNLQLQIDREEINRILLSGFVDCQKEFSTDGITITCTAADGRILEKVFTDNFSICTTSLFSAAGAVMAEVVKTFDTSGLLIESIVTYY